VPYSEVGDARIHYEIDGEGEPLVLIAGTGFDLSFWEDLVPALGGFRVLRLDNRGAGLSDAPEGPIRIEQMAEDVVTVMDAAGMPQAHVHGASMGGLIATELAIRHPERVLSLVLGSTWAGSAPVSGALRALPLLLSGKEPEQLLRASAPYLSSTPMAEDGTPFPGHDLSPRRASVLRRQLRAQLRYSSLRRLHRIKQPTLVLHGERDRLISPINARLLARRIPRARLRLIVGAGHLYQRDRPEESRDALLEFLLDAAGELLDERELGLTRQRAPSRQLEGTVVMTDIVASTEHAARLGDEAWDDLLDQHDTLVRQHIDKNDGTRIKGTGDGVLALFDSPLAAARCALGIEEHVRALGLRIRAGIHSGRFLVAGDDLHGLDLHIAARVMASATKGGVRLTHSSFVALGAAQPGASGIGAQTLPGIPGHWELYELNSLA
jgi:pimeloyl-ACP methyl ester carboxylesterase